MVESHHGACEARKAEEKMNKDTGERRGAGSPGPGTFASSLGVGVFTCARST